MLESKVAHRVNSDIVSKNNIKNTNIYAGPPACTKAIRQPGGSTRRTSNRVRPFWKMIVRKGSSDVFFVCKILLHLN